MSEPDPLQRLLDLEEIKRLKARYFRALDTKEWDEFGQVFTRDAVMEVPEAGMRQRGRDAIVASVSAALAGTRTVHHGHMPEIEVTGPDTARGTWAMFDYVEWPASESGERRGLQGYGHYVEEYVREDGQWRIARLHLSRLRVDPLGPPAAPRGRLGGIESHREAEEGPGTAHMVTPGPPKAWANRPRAPSRDRSSRSRGTWSSKTFPSQKSARRAVRILHPIVANQGELPTDRRLRDRTRCSIGLLHTASRAISVEPPFPSWLLRGTSAHGQHSSVADAV